jgi:hypothetical protein
MSVTDECRKPHFSQRREKWGTPAAPGFREVGHPVKLEVRLRDEAVQLPRAIRVGTGNPSLVV